jgi:DNA-binding GntR family transcriptional regulator
MSTPGPPIRFAIATAPLNTASLADRACAALDAAILDGSLAPGKRLTEAELAAQFGISRGPLREAINRLEGRRLLARVPNAGVRVISLGPAEIAEVFAIREVLEGLACRLAAGLRSAANLDRIGRAAAHHEALAANAEVDVEAIRSADWAFHFAVVDASGNDRLAQMLRRDVYYQLRLYRHQPAYVRSHALAAMHEHCRIVAALTAGNAMEAESLMRDHITLALDMLVPQKAEHHRTHVSVQS